MPSQLRPPAIWLVVLLSIAALPVASCGGGSGDRGDTAAAETAAAEDTAAAADESSTSDITPADVDRYVRALEARNDTLRVEAARLRAMPDRSARSSAWIRLMMPGTLREYEARAAGLDYYRYSEVASRLGDTYVALTRKDADEESKRAMLAHLRADTREALERQMPRIKSLEEETERVAEAAGITRPRMP